MSDENAGQFTRPEVTRLLKAWQSGDASALQSLTPLVQSELYRLARHFMAGERKEHTLQATALINEAWLRLIEWPNANWQNRAHFFAVSAQLMRRVLVDHARRRASIKRATAAERVSLDTALEISSERTVDLVSLDEALKSLERQDSRKSQIVELRFFGGLSEEETAEVLKVSAKTVQREWNKAKVWLYHTLYESEGL